jgi:GntR family transcriptional regulator
MRYWIDRNSSMPYYAQVRDALIEGIQTGSLKPGNQLPSEPDLCELFDVSRTVIRQALNDLVSKGMVSREKGRGTFVAEPKIKESLVQKLTGFYHDMVEQGHRPVTRVLKQELIPANRKIAGFLNIEPDTEVIEIERLRFVDDEPLQFTTTYIPYHLCPELLHEDLSNQSLYAFLEKQCGLMIARGHRSIEAIAANEFEAEQLRVKKGAPLIMLESVSFLNDGTPVEYYHAVHRGDRTRFEVKLFRVKDSFVKDKSVEENIRDLPLDGGLVLRSNDN